MPLRVIGAGFGRTGTLSLKTALEQLGFAPCHHMAEVLASPDQLARWQHAVDGGPVDWDEVLAGYAACVDWPSAYFWRSLAARYPAAPVILSTRDAEAWYASLQRTILHLIASSGRIEDPHVRAVVEMGARVVRDGVFGGELPDRERAIAVFRAHERAVRATIEPGRLLVYDVREGWGPLCAFLGVDAPDTPFPRRNDEQQFRELVR